MHTMFRTAMLSCALLAGTANAATLTQGGGWSVFYFGGDGSALIDDATNDSSYTFTLSGPAKLNITDAFIIGDIFQLTINNVLQSPTSGFDLNGPTTSDPDVAFAGTTYSKGSYLLGAGSYTVTGIVTSSPSGNGGAYIQLAGAVPEPATWGLMIAGFGLVGFAARRRRIAATA